MITYNEGRRGESRESVERIEGVKERENRVTVESRMS
jgi:hypothetical protein